MTNLQKLKSEQKKNEKLLKMISDEREKIKGYEEISRINTAYISILLNRLGATREESAAKIKADEITEALNRYEARAKPTGKGEFSLYCVDLQKGKIEK